MVALTLLRELGPVVTGLLFAGRAGSALTAEIGNMKATEQLSSLEMIGVDPLKYIVAPRLWAGFISMPLLAAIFSVVGIWGGDRGRLAGRIRGVVLGEHAEQRAVHRGCAQRRDQKYRIRLRGDLDRGLPRLRLRADLGRNQPGDDSDRGLCLLAVLGLDFILTALMFGDF